MYMNSQKIPKLVVEVQMHIVTTPYTDTWHFEVQNKDTLTCGSPPKKHTDTWEFRTMTH